MLRVWPASSSTISSDYTVRRFTAVSDRGPQFIAQFWQHLAKRLRVQLAKSTAFHPQTDGQTERINAVLEQILRATTSYRQDDWVEWLGTAEFAVNSARSASTGASPFEINYGYQPRIGFEPIPSSEEAPAIDAEEFALRMQDINDYVQIQLQVAQSRYEEYANRSREGAPEYRPGQLVWLNAQHIRTVRASRKLDWKNLGPFEVEEAVGPYAYRLKLPDTMRCHPVFHVSLLRPAATDPAPGQRVEPPPPVEVDGLEEWEVEEILDSFWERRGRGRRLKYVVKWVGYELPTEEPANYLEHASDRVRNFHRRFPQKPRPAKT